jgi:hypothetical protein
VYNSPSSLGIGMTDIFATRSKWVIQIPKLKDFDILTIRPRDDLTPKMIADALIAMKAMTPGQREFVIVQHGNKIFIQRGQP